MPNLPAPINKVLEALKVANAASPEDTSDFIFIKMDKTGSWVYGPDDVPVSDESFFAIDPMSYCQGYIAWTDNGELVDEQMAVAGQTPVTLADLPQLPAGVKWSKQVGFALKGIEGPEDGMQMLFKTSSKGGTKEIARVNAAIIAKLTSGSSEACPVVSLGMDSYKHSNKAYGTILTPVLTIDEWIDLPDGTEPAPVAAVAAPEPEPVVEPEPVAVKPKRKRSRKAA